MNKLLIKNIVLGSLLAIHSLSANSNSEEDSNLEKEVVGISGKSNQIDLVIKTEESSLPNKETNEDTQASRLIAVEECVQSLTNFNYLVGSHSYVNSYNENGRDLLLEIVKKADEHVKDLKSLIENSCKADADKEGFSLLLQSCQADVLNIMRWLNEGYAGDRYTKLMNSITNYNEKLLNLNGLIDSELINRPSRFLTEGLCYYINCKNTGNVAQVSGALLMTGIVSLALGAVLNMLMNH